jgi:hypothetical protein
MKKQLHVTTQPQPPSGAAGGAAGSATAALVSEGKLQPLGLMIGSGDAKGRLAIASRSGTGGTGESSIVLRSSQGLAIHRWKDVLAARYKSSISL